VVAAAIVIAGVLISASVFFAFAQAAKTETKTVTTTSTTTLLNSTQVPTMTVNGSLYYADDVSNDITLGGPGYSFFHNGSVTFLGVTFETYCPPSDSGCPVPPGTTVTTATMVYLVLIRFNATFPDGTVETVSGVIGDATYFYVFSQHEDPRAGILMSISYGKEATTDEVYLLVS
jgi:hypothetical protein